MIRAGATRHPHMNLPNTLTALRLLCVPLLILLLAIPVDASGVSRDLAALVFVAASITDILDGVIARRRGQVTAFGTLADPIADKALVGTALIGLCLLGDLPWWITIVILMRELGVTILRLQVRKRGIIPASRGGKAKTVLQTIAITMYLVVLPSSLVGTELGTAWQVAASVVMFLAVLLTVLTGIDYAVRAARMRRLPSDGSV